MGQADMQEVLRDCREAAARITELEALLAGEREYVERLEAALRRYARHDVMCAIVGGYGYCSCGFDAALADRRPEGEG